MFIYILQIDSTIKAKKSITHVSRSKSVTSWRLPRSKSTTSRNINDKSVFYLKHRAFMVYRCLHGQAPRYLADHLIPASDAAPRRGRLRSANRNCLTVPRCRLSTYSCCAFYYAGLTVWNSLPDELRNSDSFDSFKRFMKTILFSRY